MAKALKHRRNYGSVSSGRGSHGGKIARAVPSFRHCHGHAAMAGERESNIPLFRVSDPGVMPPLKRVGECA